MGVTIIATSRYERQARQLLTEDEKLALEDSIAGAPEAHPIVPGTGGVRKASWSRAGRGKSGGVRLIYYYWVHEAEVYMLYLYAKSQQAEMAPTDRRAAKKFVEELKRAKEEEQR